MRMFFQKLSRQEKTATATAAGILTAIAIYWITQIIGVIQMLRLAAG